MRDLIHNAVKNALIKDGWRVTHDPYKIEYEETTLFADLGLERPIAAEKAGQQMVVEIKSFLGNSFAHELEIAIGQYLIYRCFLEEIAPGLNLYLAVGQEIYEKYFMRKSIQLILKKYQLAILTVNLVEEEIVKWIIN